MLPARRWELALPVQAILIALPMAILAGGALHLLRNDRAEVEQQARDHARLIAPELARQLAAVQQSPVRATIVNGLVELPSGFARVPTPDDWPQHLPPRLAQLWRAEDANALHALLPLAAGNQQLRANVELALLKLSDCSRQQTNCTERAVDIAHRFPASVTPAGAPVAALALLLALRNIHPGTMPDSLLAEMEANTKHHASFLTPEVLASAPQTAAVTTLQQLWHAKEIERENIREALRLLATRPLPSTHPSELWVTHNGQSFLALTNPIPGGWEAELQPSTSLLAALQQTLRHTNAMPEFAGAQVEIGGELRRIAGTPPPGADPPLLASAAGVLTGHPFTLHLDLSNPAPLQARYRQSRRLITWLIFSAIGISLIGLIALWIGHRRQAELSAMKSNFVSSVSHELRAPIAAVRLMAESLESGRITTESARRNYHNLIAQECRRLSTLVGNVLDFARIDQGQQRYRLEPVDAVALLRHTVMLMQPAAELRHIRVVLSEPPDALNHRQTIWDAEAVEQSLVNLLDNAIKHSPEGAEVQVEVELRPRDVRLWVHDHGQGIPPADHSRIFERFYRRGQELRRTTQGVGIGLSIVKHVAEGHGGRVLLQSDVGKGSSFGLELPLDAGSAV